MIKFTLLSIKNFLSYGAERTIIPLDRPGTTFVRGEDLDNASSGASANGVGKTVIINALAYGCYDQPVSSISLDNLVNNVNKKHMEVIVEFTKNGKQYRIRRVRKEKEYAAGNYVELFEDGVNITLDSVKNTNEAIVGILGIPYELFVRIVVFSATSTPFLNLPLRSTYGANQTDIIEELFDLKTLSEKSEVLKEQTKEIETALTLSKARIEQLEQEHGRHTKQIQSAKQRVIAWEETTKQEIETTKQSKLQAEKQLVAIKEQLKSAQNVDLDKQRELHQQAKECQSKVHLAESSLKNTTDKMKRLKKDLTKLQEELSALEDSKCPFCKQQFHSNEKIAEITKQIQTQSKALDKEVAQQKLDEVSCVEYKKVLEGVLSQIEVQDINVLENVKKSSDLCERKIVDLERRISELEKAVNPYLEPLDELEAVVLDPINFDEINTLTTRVEHMKFLYKLLTKKDSFVRKVLLNKQLPFLNSRLQEYLRLLGLSHQVEFTHQMTAKITQFGRELDFGNLSNGQQARVNIALSFAFRDVLQSLHERVNVCMLDEVLDVGLDGVGVTAAARMLKRKARDENLSLYIISHRDEIDSAFDRTLTVQLRDGFSTIFEE